MDFTPVMHNTLLAGTDPVDSIMLRRLSEETCAIGLMAATIQQFMQISKTLPFTEIVARENGKTQLVDFNRPTNAELADRDLFTAKKLGRRRLATVGRIGRNYSNPDFGRNYRSDIMHLMMPEVVISLPRIPVPYSMKDFWDRGRMPRSPVSPIDPHNLTPSGHPMILPERTAFVTVHIAPPASAHEAMAARHVLEKTWIDFAPFWDSLFPEGQAPDIREDFLRFPFQS